MSVPSPLPTGLYACRICKHTLCLPRFPAPQDLFPFSHNQSCSLYGAQRSRDPALQIPRGPHRIHSRLYLSTCSHRWQWTQAVLLLWYVSVSVNSLFPPPIPSQIPYSRCSFQWAAQRPALQWLFVAEMRLNSRTATSSPMETCLPPTIHQSVRQTSRRGKGSSFLDVPHSYELSWHIQKAPHRHGNTPHPPVLF